MPRPEAPLEAIARNVDAAVTAALGPGTMLGAPVARAVLLPALMARPPTLALPAAGLMPGAPLVRPARGRRVHRACGRRAAPAPGGARRGRRRRGPAPTLVGPA